MGDAASVNVTISNQTIQNGSSLTFTATYDPTIGQRTFNNLECDYTDSTGGSPTRLTEYSSFNSEIIIERSLSAADKARLNITSPVNPMVLVISPIMFSDEKRLFYCNLKYFDSVGNPLILESQRHRLENVYSKYTLSY